MIRIAVTAAAYAAIAAWREGPLEKPHRSPQGGFYLFLDRVTLDTLAAARGQGEGYSDVILRLASQ